MVDKYMVQQILASGIYIDKENMFMYGPFCIILIPFDNHMGFEDHRWL